MTTAYINRIATAVPEHDVHQPFLRFAESLFRRDSGTLTVFQRMAQRSGIEHRYSCLCLTPDWETGTTLDTDALYTRSRFANTAARMRVFERRAPDLAMKPIAMPNFSSSAKIISITSRDSIPMASRRDSRVS